MYFLPKMASRQLSLINRVRADTRGLLQVDVLELGLGELEVGEFGHVDAGLAAVLLGHLLQLALQIGLRLRRGVHQLAAGALLLVGVLANLKFNDND